MLPAKTFETLSKEWSSVPWRDLSKLDEKIELYRYEPFFRECWADVTSVLGAEAVRALHRHATICFLPDAIAGRRVGPSVDFLHSQGFEIISIRETSYDWQTYNAEWRFQLNDTTLERISLSHDLCDCGPVLFMLLRDKTDTSGLPATVRLRTMKGASNPKLRSGDNLRDKLNSTNRLLKFIHTSDEPIDLIRFFGSTMERNARLSLIKLLDGAHDQPSMSAREINSRVDSIFQRFGENPLDVDASKAKLLETLQACKPETPDQQQALTEVLYHLSEAIVGNRPLDYLKFRSLIPKTGLALDRWMIVCAAADLIEHKYQALSSIIASDGSSLWLEECLV